MSGIVQVGVLGPVEVLSETGQPVAVGGPKERGVLAWLACSANRPVSMASLVDVVWGDDPPPTAVKTLQGYVSRLRGVLGSGASIERAGVGYKLVIDPAAVDVACFEAGVAQARTAAAAGDHDGAAEAFTAALGLWRGDPLAELAGSPDADVRIVNLVGLRAAAVQERFAALLAAGGGAELVADLEAAVAADPFAEGLWAALMVALYRAGRQADALDAYQRARTRLVDDLGLEPGDQLRTIEAQVIAHDPALLPDPATVERSATAGGETATDAPTAASPGSGPGSTGAVDLRVLSDLSWADSGRAVIFVGRDRELDRLIGTWDEVVASGGRWLALVSGEAGIGKTRLAGELARHVAAAGGLVLHGRCDDGVAVAFQPFTEALGTWARRCPTDRLVDRVEGQVPLLARVVPAIADRLDHSPEELVVPESDSEQHRTFEAVSDLLDRLTTTDDGDVDQAAPVLLVVDDLHWAARPTLLLLHHLLRRPSRSPLLVVATYRGTDLTASTPLTNMLGTLHRTERVTTVALRGLDRAAVREFVELAADHHLDDTIAAFADTLCDQTGGNPFFIATVLAHLAETGAIVRRGERWEAAGDLTHLDLPEGVRRVVGLRLHQIGDTTVDALRTAAVIGTSFSLDLLAAVGGHDPDRLLDAMDEAAANGLITETGDRWGTYRFAHDLVRATLVDEVSTTRRIRLHWRIAQALDTATTPDLDLLAFHAHEGVLAGDPATAADMLHRAAVDADRRSAYDSAVTYATWGLDALTDTDGHDELRVDLATTRACALLETGRRVDDPDLIAACEHAEAAALTLDDPDRIVDALTLRSRVYPSTDAFVIDHRRIAATRTALDTLPHEARTARARLTALLAHLLIHDTCVDERGLLVDEALRLLDDTTPVEIVDRVLIDCAQALLHPRHTERYREIAILLAGRKPLVAAANGVSGLAITDLVLGNFDTARTRAQLMAQMADDMRLAGSKIVATMILCACADTFGDLDAVDQLEATLTEFSPLPARIEPLAGSLRNHINYLRVLWAGDRTDVDDATRASIEAGSPETATVWTTPLPWTHLVCGDPQTARAAWEPLRNQPLTDLDHSVATLGDLAAVADLAAAFGDDNERTAAHTALQPYRDWFAGCTSGCFGPIRLYLGKLDLALGRVDDAAGHLDVAAEMCASRGLDAWLARVDIQRARVALARGDEEQAEVLLDGAAATGDAMGLPIIAREVAEVREQVG